jgi:streptogramin lyase
LLVALSLIVAVPAHARITTVAKRGPALGAVSTPTSVAVGSDGNLLVGEQGNVRVQKLTPAGEPLLAFGSHGSDPGQFGGTDRVVPLGVVGGPDGSIYVRDHSTEMVNRFISSGEFVSRWSLPAGSADTRGMAVGEDGVVYASAGMSVVRYSPAGASLGSWVPTDPQERPARVADLAYGGGRVYVLATSGLDYTGITVHAPGGALLERWPPTPAASAPGSLVHAAAITADSAGNVYAAGSDAIWKFSPHGALLGSFVVCCGSPPSAYDGCRPFRFSNQWSEDQHSLSVSDLTAAPDGTLYLADQGASRIVRVEQSPHAHLAVGPPLTVLGPFARYTGQYITLDASGTATPLADGPRSHQWDLDGDGDFELDTKALAEAVTTYPEAGDRLVRVRVTDSNGESAVAEATFRIDESVAILVPERFVAGRTARVDATVAALDCSKVLKHEWDLDGDGKFERDSGTNPVVKTVFRKVGTRQITLRVTRPGGRVDVATAAYDIVPAPPDGPVGVSIDGGARFTNSRRVTVNAVWPAGTSQLYLSNDGGFQPHERFTVTAAIPWLLPPGGPERLPRTVYLRFDGLTWGAAYQDDIVLDQTDPAVLDAQLVPAAAPRSARVERRLVVRARDRISGVARMQLATARSHPGEWRKFARRSTIPAGERRLWVRVRDRAGNRSRWRLAKAG